MKLGWVLSEETMFRLRPKGQEVNNMVLMVKNLPAMQETWVQPLSWEDPLEEGMATWRISMDRGARWATVHGIMKSWT